MKADSCDYALEAYDYPLPEKLIAQSPPQNRGESRLLIVDRHGSAQPKDEMFANLGRYLPEGALLVANNAKVTHARLIGRRMTGGKVELLLLTPFPVLIKRKIASVSGWECRIQGLLKPAGKISVGEILEFGGGARFKLEKKGEYGQSEGILYWDGDLGEWLRHYAQLPLPPYIKRNPELADESRYQTVYGKMEGSVAAPTAGLHFTDAQINALKAEGFVWAFLTLHVGYGTFSPVRRNDIRRHEMHSEYVEMSWESASLVTSAILEKRPIIAVGTTSLRALEGIYAQTGAIGEFSGLINIFLYPGCEFKVIDGLITNLHLPKSTLLMLVSAFAGRERILSAYAHAIEQSYRFFSYGDAMLII